MQHVIVSKAHRMLVVPDLEVVRNMFPEAPFMEAGYGGARVIPHTLRDTIILNRLGFKAPAPILSQFDWCGTKPFSVQKATAVLLTMNPRAYVLNAMGTGKTMAALLAWESMYRDGNVGKLLVVAPLTSLNFTWGRECFKVLPHRKVQVLGAVNGMPKAKRLERLANLDTDIYVVNHDGLRVIAKEIQARKDIDVLVLDELGVYRNNSERSKLMRKFAQRFRCVWGMTGTPMPNAPTDVWAQCQIITPHTVPKYYRQAEAVLMLRENNFTLKPKADAVEIAHSWMQPAVRYSLDEVVELPPAIERTIDVELSAEQKKVYATIVKEFTVMVKSKQITALNAAAAMGKLLQVALGWVYTKAPEFVTLDATPRMDALLDVLASAPDKTIVFVPFRHALDGISKLLTGPDPDKPMIEHAVVHGDVPDRENIFHLFQNTTKYPVLLAHPKCMSHSLTLTAASTTLWTSPTTSLDQYEQANARIRRIGQIHKQQFLHLQATPVERKLYAALRKKQAVQNMLLELFSNQTGDA